MKICIFSKESSNDSDKKKILLIREYIKIQIINHLSKEMSIAYNISIVGIYSI